MIAVAPVLVGVAPFGLVMGVASVEGGLHPGEAVGFSTVVFAGAAQLAAIELLADGAPVWVAIMTAVVINLRMAMYSASMASHMTREPAHRRALVSYLLTDQAFALSVAGYQREESDDRFWYFLGTALPPWVVWQSMTVVGLLIGGTVPEALPLGFAVPLTFLSLLVPTVRDRPTLAAALAAGTVAVAGGGLPANLGMPLGALTGIAAGVAASRRERTSWA